MLSYPYQAYHASPAAIGVQSANHPLVERTSLLGNTAKKVKKMAPMATLLMNGGQRIRLTTGGSARHTIEKRAGSTMEKMPSVANSQTPVRVTGSAGRLTAIRNARTRLMNWAARTVPRRKPPSDRQLAHGLHSRASITRDR